MFGYIVTNAESLPKDRQDRFRAFYCGLCRVLRARHGWAGGATLSYDMTFLAVLLNALYEPGETAGEERCPTHPVKKHGYVVSPVMDYVADMNLALAYHKCQDNWLDDRSLPSAAEAKLLKRGYGRVKAAHPEKCAAIEGWLEEIHAIEKAGGEAIDPPVNATGRMLGELFDWKGDVWSQPLRELGDGLGRFVYFMDAYDDLPSDEKRGGYNPLKSLRGREDFEAFCRDAMLMMAGDAAQAYEMLPIVEDGDILGNILYSGIWSRYAQLQAQRTGGNKGEK